MSKILDNNYFQISGWMLNRLKLKGIALNVYAIIYGFTQDGECSFKGSRQYLCDFTGATKPTIDKALAELQSKKLISKTSKVVNGVVFNEYKANIDVLNNFTTDKEFLPPSKETLQGGSKETLPNNKDLDNKKNNKDKKENIIIKEKAEKVNENRFVKPTIAEIQAYCDERGNGIDAEYFYAHYESKGWRVGKTPMKNWKMAVITWEKNNKSNIRGYSYASEPIKKGTKNAVDNRDDTEDNRYGKWV